jgi:hypothetical protein
MPSIQAISDPNILSYRKFLAETGVSNTTGWRWAKQGWISPFNIAGRLYVTREQIAAFRTRAANGEFAKAATGAAARVDSSFKTTVQASAHPGGSEGLPCAK